MDWLISSFQGCGVRGMERIVESWGSNGRRKLIQIEPFEGEKVNRPARDGLAPLESGAQAGPLPVIATLEFREELMLPPVRVRGPLAELILALLHRLAV